MSDRDRRSSPRVIVYRALVNKSDVIWEVEYAAIADALHFACRDLREGRRTPLSIVEDGVQIYDADAIQRSCNDEHTGEAAAAAKGDGESEAE